MPSTNCPKCERPVNCTTSASCWCHDWPPILSPTDSDSCLCSTCIKAAILQKADQMVAGAQHTDIAQLGPVKQPVEGLDYTINTDGLLVFTKWYHLRRGSCCGSGCLNCPY